MRIGVIGGTGLYALFDEPPEDILIETPYGDARVQYGRLNDGPELVFLNRHGLDHTVPPHRIDARRTVEALSRAKAEVVIAVNNTGALKSPYGPGEMVIPHDFVDLTGRTDDTFYDDRVVHVDLSMPYCPHVRAALVAAARDGRSDPVHDEAVYVGVRGPRLETPAEVRRLATYGDIVGMTGCPEAALARERGLCYASLCFIANPAASPGGHIVAESIRRSFLDHAERIRGIILDAARAVPSERTCRCRAAPEDGVLVPRVEATETVRR